MYSDGECDLERLTDIICRFQEEFTKSDGWIVSYSLTCSKPKLDAFGGGAVLCYKGEAYYFDPIDLAETKLDDLIVEDTNG